MLCDRMIAHRSAQSPKRRCQR